MNKRRFSIVTAATAAWALASWLVMSTGTQPADGMERSTAPAAEQPQPGLPGASPDGHYVGAALRPLPELAPRAAMPVANITARRIGTAVGTPFDEAMSHYEAGRYAQAFAMFSRLADCGHRDAARIAMQMRRHGAQLYGMAFTASEPQINRWHEVLVAATEPATDRCTPS